MGPNIFGGTVVGNGVNQILMQFRFQSAPAAAQWYAFCGECVFGLVV